MYLKVLRQAMAIKKNHSKILGVDFDPNQDMEVDVKSDGDAEVKYKGDKMGFNSYIDELEERADRHSKGKSITTKSIGTFSGFGKGTLRKSYKI